MKVASWNDLKESFNCMCKGSPRSVTQLKAQWGLIKIKEKKNKAEQRRDILRTGGGPPPVIDAVSTEDISSWLPNEFIIDSNEFDSDNINQHKLHPSTCGKLNDMITVNVDSVEAPPPPMPSGLQLLDPPASPRPSSSQLLDPPKSPMPSSSQLLGQGPKPRKIKKKFNKQVVSPAELVAACEIECRRELHVLQLKNENLKTENLKLEEELLKYKIEYYKKNNKLN